MAELEWYNVNANRPYPLRGRVILSGPTTFEFPVSSLVDMGLVLGSELPFDPEEDFIYLGGLRAPVPGTIMLQFFNAEEILLFVALIPFTAAAGDIIPLTLNQPGGDSVGYGFVIVGDISKLVSAVAEHEGSTWSATGKNDPADMRVEPRAIQSLFGSVVTRVSLWNLESTKWVAPGATVESPGYEKVASDWDGILYALDGYSVSAIISSANNSITWRSSPGSGDGFTCNWPGVAGMPMCGELIASINGVQADAQGKFRLVAGPPLKVVKVDDHTLRVTTDNRIDPFCSDLPAQPPVAFL